MNDRDKAIIERAKESVREDGIVEMPIHMGKDGGYGDFESFFDLMVDLRLRGIKQITSQEVWEDMKMQILGLSSTINRAAKDYTKLANKYRDLEKEYYDLIKEK